MFNSPFRVHVPDKGTLLYDGEPVVSARPATRRCRGRDGLPGPRDHAAHERDLNFFSWAMSRPRALAVPAVRPARAAGIAHEEKRTVVDIRDTDQAVGMLSGGERQMLAIARAEYWGQVLILDEPTSAHGVKQSAFVLRHIIAARNRDGTRGRSDAGSGDLRGVGTPRQESEPHSNGTGRHARGVDIVARRETETENTNRLLQGRRGARWKSAGEQPAPREGGRKVKREVKGDAVRIPAPSPAPAVAKNPKETRHPHRWAWQEVANLTERMLAALTNGVQGGRWYSLMDKVASPRTLVRPGNGSRPTKGRQEMTRLAALLCGPRLTTWPR